MVFVLDGNWVCLTAFDAVEVVVAIDAATVYFKVRPPFVQLYAIALGGSKVGLWNGCQHDVAVTVIEYRPAVDTQLGINSSTYNSHNDSQQVSHRLQSYEEFSNYSKYMRLLISIPR